MSAPDDTVIAYLKTAGLYSTFAAAAGVAKDAGVADVHVPTSGGKPKPVVGAAKTPEEEAAEAAAVTKSEDIAKRIAEVDVVFAKGEANLYVSRPLTPGSAQRLHEWAEAQGIQNVVPAELMHVTQVHSTAEVDTSNFKPLQTLIDIGDNRWLSTLGKDGKAVVMMFSSPEMSERFREAAKCGASWDFPSYMPHVTLSYDAGGVANAEASWGMMEAPTGPLQLGPEEFKQSNSTWVDDNGLAKSMPITVSKSDPDLRMIWGWASVSTLDGKVIVDKQGDVIPINELEKAAYDFTLYSRQHGDMHAKIGTGSMIESMVFTPEKAALGLVAKNAKGEQMTGWWVGFRVDDAHTWAEAKAGRLPEFSIGGRATPTQVA